MPAVAKRILFLLAAIILLGALSLAFAWSRLDVEALARDVARHVQEKTGLQLQLDAPTRVALLPRPSVTLGRGALRGNDGAQLLTFEALGVDFSWLPLPGFGSPRITGIEADGLRGDAAGLFALSALAQNAAVRLDLDDIRLRRAELHFASRAGQPHALHLDEARARIAGGAIDWRGSGSGLGIDGLAFTLQSTPRGAARDLALAVKGMHGTEKFDLRLVADALQLTPDSFSLSNATLAATFTQDEAGRDVAVEIPLLRGPYGAAQAEGGTLAVTHAWKGGRLTLTYSGAASLDIATGQMAWPMTDLLVSLYVRGAEEREGRWSGASRFDAPLFAAFRP
jgi:hypothetical protein